MSVGAMLLTHTIAHREKKLPFFFSRFTFERMKEVGNTHYCFFCLSNRGFKLGPNGEILDSVGERGYSGMDHHDATHAGAVIGNADKYNSPHAWLEKEIPKDFPCIINIPSV